LAISCTGSEKTRSVETYTVTARVAIPDGLTVADTLVLDHPLALKTERL
jgi:hypothetical protein